MEPLCDYRHDKLQKQRDTHMVEPQYDAIYKLSNFVVAIVIRGVWSYDCESGIYYLITRTITK